MKTPYSQDYFPPAPVLLVNLAAPEESPQIGKWKEENLTYIIWEFRVKSEKRVEFERVCPNF